MANATPTASNTPGTNQRLPRIEYQMLRRVMTIVERGTLRSETRGCRIHPNAQGAAFLQAKIVLAPGGTCDGAWGSPTLIEDKRGSSEVTEVAWWFNGWEPIARTLLVGTLGYFSIVVLLRFGKKRTLASLNAFDFVVVVAIGAAFGRVLTARHVALAEAIAAFALLVALQFVISWLQIRFRSVHRLVMAGPTLLFYRGEYLLDAMREERVTEEDLKRAARHHGAGSMDLVDAIVLECDGRFSIIKKNADDLSLTRPARANG
jgi:uncharacterized membrane protein YcaP (DUF421 family)